MERCEEETLAGLLKGNINSWVGKKFESVIAELIKKGDIELPFPIEKVGKQWGKIPNKPKGEVYEIDVVALNEKTKEILFCECKWQDKVNAKRICKELIENKIPYVDWNNEDRKESIAIFARSFKEKIEEFDGRKVYCFDLRDLERFMKRGIWKS